MDRKVALLYAEDNASDADLTRHHFATHAPDIQLDIVDHGEACLTRRGPWQRCSLRNTATRNWRSLCR